MSTTSQIQLKLSLSQQLADLLQSKAAKFGIPVTQFVKHLIIKEVENETYPAFQASDWTQNRVKKAMNEISDSADIDSNDLHQFFENL